MLPMSLLVAAISRLFHSSVRAFPSSTRVLGWTGRRKIATCSMFQTCSVGLRSGERAGQSTRTMVSCWRYIVLSHPGTMRSSVVVHEDELGSDCTSERSDVDVQDIIPVAYASHHVSHRDVQVCSSTSADTSPHHDGARLRQSGHARRC